MTRVHSIHDQLTIISRIVSRELQADWCPFYLLNEQGNSLQLETSNIDTESPVEAPIDAPANIFEKCFKQGLVIPLLGRKTLEETIPLEHMKPIEKEIREKKKQTGGKRRFNPYIIFEHALLVPIIYGKVTHGVMPLFRAKETGNPRTDARFKFKMRPFSAFETHLVMRVQQHISTLFVAHAAVQKRMKDIENMLVKVVNPLSEAITSTSIGKSLPGKDIPGKGYSEESAIKKLSYVNALSNVTLQYVRNFKTLLKLDTRPISLEMVIIPDVKKCLIDIARVYIPFVQKKFIHVNVTENTRKDLSLEVDPDLFKMVVSNIIDNAVKYSFDREARELHHKQAIPKSMKDEENILVTAKEELEWVIITISNYGIELKENEEGKIFDREFRGVGAAQWAEGTGIGLYLSKKIVDAHDGEIKLLRGATPNHTIFEIKLPKSRNTASRVPNNDRKREKNHHVH